ITDQPGDREGDDAGQEDEQQEICREQPDQRGDGSAEHFADPDLFGPSFSGVAREAEKAETGDKDSEGGEDAGKAAGQGLGLELVLEVILHKTVFEWIAGVVGLQYLFGSCQRFRDVGVWL